MRDYFVTNFTLINNFSWSLSDIENMVYWERDIYIKLVAEYQDKKKQDQQMRNMQSEGYFNL